VNPTKTLDVVVICFLQQSAVPGIPNLACFLLDLQTWGAIPEYLLEEPDVMVESQLMVERGITSKLVVDDEHHKFLVC